MSASGSSGRRRFRSRCTPKRLVDHRAASGHDLDPDADRGEWNDDVGEQDRGVDPVAAYRLQRELGGELRLGDGVEDVALAAERGGTRAESGRPGA